MQVRDPSTSTNGKICTTGATERRPGTAASGPYRHKDWEEWSIMMSWNKRIPWRQRMMRWGQVRHAGKDGDGEDSYEDTMSVGGGEEESRESIPIEGEDGISPMGGGGGDDDGDGKEEGVTVPTEFDSSRKKEEKISEVRMENNQEEDENVEVDEEDGDTEVEEEFYSSRKEEEEIISEERMENNQEEQDNVDVDEEDGNDEVEEEFYSSRKEEEEEEEVVSDVRMENNQEEDERGEEDGDQSEFNSSQEEDEKTSEGRIDDDLEEEDDEEEDDNDVEDYQHEGDEVYTESDSGREEHESADGRIEESQEEEDEEEDPMEHLHPENSFRAEMKSSEEDETETEEEEDTSEESEDGIRLKGDDDSSKPEDLDGESGSWISQETAQSDKFLKEETSTTDLWTTDEELDEDEEDPQEDFGEDDAVFSTEEDEEIKIYRKDCYPLEVFSTLNELRKSSLLTDLTLSTADGKSFDVHAVVLAAVSSLVRRNLTRNIACSWSRILDPEVEEVGLETVVEFAYTGSVSNLNRDNVDQIRTAARTLEASRVLEICNGAEEEAPKPAGGQKTSSTEQLIFSLQVIRQLWEDGLGCDLILSADGETLSVHRAVLAASSDYFRSMFTLGMKEATQRRVSLPYVSSSELQILISCSYSGSLPLCWGSVYELTATALQLQYQPALALCLDFLLQELDPHVCLDVRSFAEAFEVPQLLQGADDFVLRQFQKVACTPKFKDLPARQLMTYLRSHALCVSSEMVVFQAVVTWIQARQKTRLRLAKALMKTIHFPLMTFKEFKEVRSHSIWSEHGLTPLFQSIFEDFCSNETRTQNQCRIYLPKESLVLIGGDHITDDLSGRSISKDLWFGHSLRSHTGFKKAMEWRRLDEMPDASFSHEVAILNGKLYVLGGKTYYGNGDILNSVYRFDPHLSSWERLAHMLERRSFFSVVVLDDKIYAIGGSGDPDYNDTVERYCPSTNSWSFTLPLDLALSGHVAKVLQGHVFVSGGQNADYLSLSSVFLYHPETGSTYLANMARPRAHHCMEVLGERLYVAGGVTTSGESAVVDLLECEVYNPTTDTWTWLMPLPVPRVGAGSVVMEGKFYVLGGYSQEDYSDTKTIHRYDCVAQRWENVGRMPGPNNDIRACLLVLPKHLRS